MKKIGLALLLLTTICSTNSFCTDYDPNDCFFLFPRLFIGSNDSLFDEQGNVLPGNQELGIAGAVVQFLLDGGDGVISPPDANGNNTGDDIIKFSTTVAIGQLAIYGEIGIFATICNYTDENDQIFIRIFNATDLANATYYGQTELCSISDLPRAPNSTDYYFNVDEHGLINTSIPLDSQSDVGSIANAGGSYAGTEGSIITLDASATTDTDTDVSSIVFTWDLDGDRQFDDATGSIVSYAWPDNYSGIVRVRATNPQTGISGIATTQASITNAAPSIDAIADTSAYVGKQLNLSATYSDPGFADTHIIDITWGDNEVENDVAVSAGIINLEHTYSTQGTYTVQITITDDDGASDSTSFQLEVTAQPVSVQASLSYDNGMTINWEVQSNHHYEIWFTDDDLTPFDTTAQKWQLLDIVTTSPYSDIGDIDGYDDLLDTYDDRLSPTNVDHRFYSIIEIAD